MQRLKAKPVSAQVKVELERGKRYAIEGDALKKQNGFATARMGIPEPVPID
jgi:hypothetical protein